MASPTCTAPPPLTVRGTHQFEIVGYSLIRGLAAGEFVRSGTFSVGGHRWSVRFYPGGFSSPHRADAELRAPRGAPRLVRTKRNARASAAPASSCRGAIKASPYVRGDRLTIECVLDIVAADKEQAPEAMALCQVVRLPPSDLSLHLGGLLKNQQDQTADISIDVEGEVFHAHKVVLAARSPVFKAQLYGPMKEQETKRIAIGDMRPVLCFASFTLTFFSSQPTMTSEGMSTKETVRQILEAADRYGMERLKLICESILCRSLDANTVATTLALADQHYCKALKDVCVQFMCL
ncbi:hypothetical protein EJB05_09999, partial [Eragrostis curvula]